jgi:CheY-like chemotaxis protein/two-component sensor histidine kinase
MRTRAARAEAEAASQAKDQFLAMLSHELRNPLAAISSAVSVLGQSVTPEHDRRARDVIAHQTDHLSRLVSDLLDVTRGALGKIELVRAPIDAAAAVRRCVATLESSQKLGQHVVTVDAATVWVEADGARFEQIVMNLLSNSLKFTPRGGAIKVTVGREGHEAVLRVTDDGAGIPAELLPSVFDLFVQGDQDLGRHTGGLGVGLSLVRRLVELHGGRVEATSPGEGRGSVFTVRLPALADAPHAFRQAVEAPAETPSRRILIVEDNPDNREMMRILLATAGYEAHEAGDGVSGVEIAVQLEPDVVLVDIGLPGIDGYAVARQIRSKLRGRCRLIALSGYGQQKDRERAADAGFDEHLLKPVDPARLLAALTASGDAPAR